jgi:hypothetical protein
MRNVPHAESFILIPGRTSRQGTTLNESKLTGGYVEEISTLLMAPESASSRRCRRR